MKISPGKIITLISGKIAKNIGMHSLKYFLMASSEVTNFPEFVAVGMVDDIQITYYDSNTKRGEPKQDWMKKVTEDKAEYWEWETERAVGAQQTFKVRLDTFKQGFNQTGGLNSNLSSCLSSRPPHSVSPPEDSLLSGHLPRYRFLPQQSHDVLEERWRGASRGRGQGRDPPQPRRLLPDQR
uniref:MHC class I-like antigen recognition-like domain-containing protein n=1 Tax=Labrus bergylta TaxID=56723 RepID=A0A3Q3G5K0_9LABR